MTLFYFLIYNLLFVPVLFLASHLAMLFNRKLRQGVLGRYRVFDMLRRYDMQYAYHPVMVVHCASLGEYEHIKPFLREFKRARPDFRTIVLFFSPSGYRHARFFSGVDLFLYAPFDWFLSLWRFHRMVRPTLWVIAKHDVWPNQVWMAHWLGVPIFLINASLHDQSSRLLAYTRAFHRNIYRKFTAILAVSDSDRNNFLKLVEESRVKTVGDTKYDQVFYRRDESRRKDVLPLSITRTRWIFVAGSTWPEDHRHLLPAIRSVMETHPDFVAVICPHEPTEAHLRELLEAFPEEQRILYSEIEQYREQPVIIVDQVGILANLYSTGKVAYVGGSFKQNIHNVLEAAVYEIPVLFGPVNQNSHEAQLLKANGGAFQVHDAREIEQYLRKFLTNDIFRQEVGKRAYQVVRQNAGATRRTVEIILQSLPETTR